MIEFHMPNEDLPPGADVIEIKRGIPPARCYLCGGVVDGNGDNWNESQGVLIHNECPYQEEPDMEGCDEL